MANNINLKQVIRIWWAFYCFFVVVVAALVILLEATNSLVGLIAFFSIGPGKMASSMLVIGITIFFGLFSIAPIYYVLNKDFKDFKLTVAKKEPNT